MNKPTSFSVRTRSVRMKSLANFGLVFRMTNDGSKLVLTVRKLTFRSIFAHRTFHPTPTKFRFIQILSTKLRFYIDVPLRCPKPVRDRLVFTFLWSSTFSASNASVMGSQGVVGEGGRRVFGVVFVGMTYASQFNALPEPEGSWNQVSMGTSFGGGSI